MIWFSISLLDASGLRAFMYDVTQHIVFKRAVAMLVLANCGLLAVPVSYPPPLKFFPSSWAIILILNSSLERVQVWIENIYALV